MNTQVTTQVIKPATKPLYGVMAEFDSPTGLVAAARAAREKGYRKIDAYSPFPIEELTDALHLHTNKLPLLVLLGGLLLVFRCRRQTR